MMLEAIAVVIGAGEKDVILYFHEFKNGLMNETMWLFKHKAYHL